MGYKSNKLGDAVRDFLYAGIFLVITVMLIIRFWSYVVLLLKYGLVIFMITAFIFAFAAYLLDGITVLKSKDKHEETSRDN